MGRNPMYGFPVYVKRVRTTSPQGNNEPFRYEEISYEEYERLNKEETIKNDCGCPLCKAGIPSKSVKFKT